MLLCRRSSLQGTGDQPEFYSARARVRVEVNLLQERTVDNWSEEGNVRML